MSCLTEQMQPAAGPLKALQACMGNKRGFPHQLSVGVGLLLLLLLCCCLCVCAHNWLLLNPLPGTTLH
jgi:hypothetical protein